MTRPEFDPLPRFPACPGQGEFLVFYATEGFVAVRMDLVECFQALDGQPGTAVHIAGKSEAYYVSKESVPELVARYAAVKAISNSPILNCQYRNLPSLVPFRRSARKTSPRPAHRRRNLDAQNPQQRNRNSPLRFLLRAGILWAYNVTIMNPQNRSRSWPSISNSTTQGSAFSQANLSALTSNAVFAR
jgi:hypothetical protein